MSSSVAGYTSLKDKRNHNTHGLPPAKRMKLGESSSLGWANSQQTLTALPKTGPQITSTINKVSAPNIGNNTPQVNKMSPTKPQVVQPKDSPKIPIPAKQPLRQNVNQNTEHKAINLAPKPLPYNKSNPNKVNLNPAPVLAPPSNQSPPHSNPTPVQHNSTQPISSVHTGVTPIKSNPQVTHNHNQSKPTTTPTRPITQISPIKRNAVSLSEPKRSSPTQQIALKQPAITYSKPVISTQPPPRVNPQVTQPVNRANQPANKLPNNSHSHPRPHPHPPIQKPSNPPLVATKTLPPPQEAATPVVAESYDHVFDEFDDGGQFDELFPECSEKQNTSAETEDFNDYFSETAVDDSFFADQSEIEQTANQSPTTVLPHEPIQPEPPAVIHSVVVPPVQQTIQPKAITHHPTPQSQPVHPRVIQPVVQQVHPQPTAAPLPSKNIETITATNTLHAPSKINSNNQTIDPALPNQYSPVPVPSIPPEPPISSPLPMIVEKQEQAPPSPPIVLTQQEPPTNSMNDGIISIIKQYEDNRRLLEEELNQTRGKLEEKQVELNNIKIETQKHDTIVNEKLKALECEVEFKQKDIKELEEQIEKLSKNEQNKENHSAAKFMSRSNSFSFKTKVFNGIEEIESSPILVNRKMDELQEKVNLHSKRLQLIADIMSLPDESMSQIFTSNILEINNIAIEKFQSKLDEQAKKITTYEKERIQLLADVTKKEDEKQKLLLENKSYARKLEEYKKKAEKDREKVGTYRAQIKKYSTQLQNIQQIYDQKARLHKETINNMKKQLESAKSFHKKTTKENRPAIKRFNSDSSPSSPKSPTRSSSSHNIYSPELQSNHHSVALTKSSPDILLKSSPTLQSSPQITSSPVAVDIFSVAKSMYFDDPKLAPWLSSQDVDGHMEEDTTIAAFARVERS